jgi:hypothetical protein
LLQSAHQFFPTTSPSPRPRRHRCPGSDQRPPRRSSAPNLAGSPPRFGKFLSTLGFGSKPRSSGTGSGRGWGWMVRLDPGAD